MESFKDKINATKDFLDRVEFVLVIMLITGVCSVLVYGIIMYVDIWNAMSSEEIVRHLVEQR